jgi:Uma2 family endonuclease
MYELDEGRLVVMSHASAWSSLVATVFADRIRPFVRRGKLGVCLGPDGGMLLRRRPDTLRAPDFSFLGHDRFPQGFPRCGYFPGTPDFAIEVLSPSDRFANTVRKVHQYLRAGTRRVWVVEPEARTVVIFRPGQEIPEIVGPDGTLSGEGVLPGFTRSLAELWAELDLIAPSSA